MGLSTEAPVTATTVTDPSPEQTVQTFLKTLRALQCRSDINVWMMMMMRTTLLLLYLPSYLQETPRSTLPIHRCSRVLALALRLWVVVVAAHATVACMVVVTTTETGIVCMVFLVVVMALVLSVPGQQKVVC
jgi:hypothetical protein